MSAAPNLKGIQNIGLTIQRPENDDKYGNAVVDAADLNRLSRVTKGLVKIVGTLQTQPSVDANGQPDRLARNADKLHLAAIVAQFGGDAFLINQKPMSVAAIPIAVKMNKPTKLSGANVAKPNDTFYDIQWGAKYTFSFTSDSGNVADLDKAKASEIIDQDPNATGVFQGAAQKVGKFDWIVGGTWVDRNSFGTRIKKTNAQNEAEAKEKAEAWLTGEVKKKGNGHQAPVQHFVFQEFRTGWLLNTPVGKAKPIIESGYLLDETVGFDKLMNLAVTVVRSAKANNGCKPGLLGDKAGEKVVDTV